MKSIKGIFTVLRVIIGIGLAFGLVYGTIKSTESDIWESLYRANRSLLIFSLIFHGMILLIACYRWNLLLRAQGIYLPIVTVLRLSIIGVFFNLTLPGAVSGDIVKMSMIMKYSEDKKMERFYPFC